MKNNRDYDYHNAVKELMDNGVSLRKVQRAYRDIAIAGGQEYLSEGTLVAPDFKSGKIAPTASIDAQTHADVVELIRIEMGEVACGNHGHEERLASLIEARIAAVKKSSCLLGDILTEAGVTFEDH